MTIEGYEGGHVLVSYDVSGSKRSVAVRVCQIVFGRSVTSRPKTRKRRAEGFIWRPGVVWIGQWVLVLPPRGAAELTDGLRKLGVHVAQAPVSIGRSALEAFRRGRRASA